MDAGLARPLPRPRRALDGRGADRGGDQGGLPRRSSASSIIEPLGLGRRAVRRPARRASTGARSTCTSRRRRRAPGAGAPRRTTPPFRRAGVPGGGGYATARAMAAFYQMMAPGRHSSAACGCSRRGWSSTSRATSPATGRRLHGHADASRARPARRAAPPTTIRGLGTLASPRTFGHGGVGSSYCWADPDSGVSFAYLTNSRVPDPWHSQRLDMVSNCGAHGHRPVGWPAKRRKGEPC